MCYISTRTTGRTSPNTRLPSHGSNNSPDCHCVKKGRGDENLSHTVLVGIVWKHSARGRRRRVVAPLSGCEADAGFGNQKGEFHCAGFYGHLAGHTSSTDRSAAGSGPNLAATVAEHWGEDRQGRTESGRRRDSHHRECRRGRKATGLRPSAVLRLCPEGLCRCHVPIRPKRTATIHSLQPGSSSNRTRVFSGQAESAASGAEHRAGCHCERSITSRCSYGTSQAVGRATKRNRPPGIHRPGATGT